MTLEEQIQLANDNQLIEEPDNSKLKYVVVLKSGGVYTKDNAIALVEGAIGSVVFAANACLVYVATLIASFFLFAFAVVGTLVGVWIAIPASFE